MQRVVAVDQPVVGVAEDAALGVEEARVGGIGRHPLPAVFRDPAGRGDAPLALVFDQAPRHVADHLHADPVARGDGQHLRGRHEMPPRVHRRLDRVGAHDLQKRAQRGVFIRQRSPRHRHHMALRGDGAEIPVIAGDDRAVFRIAQGDRDRRAIGHLDDRAAGFERGPAVRGAVLFGVVGVHLFDMQVDIVHVGRGDAPADRLVAARQDAGHAGDGAADDAAGLKLQPCEIPDRRRGQAQMRIVGQKGGPGGRAGRRRRPGVRRPRQARAGIGKERVARAGLGLRQARHIGKQGRIFGQFGHRVARRVGQDIGEPRGIVQRQRGARAQHLRFLVAGQLHCHHVHNGDGIGGPPRGDPGREQQQFRRAAAKRLLGDQFQPRIHTGGIGFQHRQRFGVLRAHRAAGMAVEVEPPHQLIKTQGSFAEQLRQPALRGAPQHQHLPQPILRMAKPSP